MKTVRLTLPAELHSYVESKVRSGEFKDVNEVIRHAIEELRDVDVEWTPEVLAYYRREVGHGIQQLRSGELAQFTAEDVIAEERARLQREQGA